MQVYMHWRHRPDLIDFARCEITDRGKEMAVQTLKRVPVCFGFDGLGVLEKWENTIKK